MKIEHGELLNLLAIFDYCTMISYENSEIKTSFTDLETSFSS